MESGWLCPRCQRINAPFVRQCECAQWITYQPYPIYPPAIMPYHPDTVPYQPPRDFPIGPIYPSFTPLPPWMKPSDWTACGMKDDGNLCTGCGL